MGRESEIARAEALERAGVEAEPLAQLDNVGDVGIAQSLLAGEDQGLLPQRLAHVPHEIVVDRFSGGVGVERRIARDRLDRPEQRERRMARAVDRRVGQVAHVAGGEPRPPGRLQPEAPDPAAGETEVERFAGRATGDERPLRPQVSRADAGMRHRTDGEAHSGPFGVEIIFDQPPFGALDLEGVKRGEIRLQRLRQAVVPHLDCEPLVHRCAPFRDLVH